MRFSDEKNEDSWREKKKIEGRVAQGGSARQEGNESCSTEYEAVWQDKGLWPRLGLLRHPALYLTTIAGHLNLSAQTLTKPLSADRTKP